jgi:predicted unusual protein kinase regulating ubiquinone biosynthesis (AarF/ABC1/UbiB family)
MRPGIREQIVDDLDAFTEIAQLFDRHAEAGRLYQFEKMVDEFRKTLLRELDYRQEAQNLLTLRENLKEFRRIVVPAPVEDFTTSRVLTMEYVFGRKITSLSALTRMEIDGATLAEELHKAYLKQILVDGFFHADPHPGNVFLNDDGKLALLDLGMIGRISPVMQENLLKSSSRSAKGVVTKPPTARRRSGRSSTRSTKRSSVVASLSSSASTSTRR